LPPQVKNKIYFICTVFFVDIVDKIDYTLIVVVGQTAINYLGDLKMLADGQITIEGIMILLAVYGAYKLFPIILDGIFDNKKMGGGGDDRLV